MSTTPLIAGDDLRRARELGITDEVINLYNETVAATNKAAADAALIAELDAEIAENDKGMPSRFNSGVAPADVARIIAARDADNATLAAKRLADVAEWDRRRQATVGIITAAIAAATTGGAAAALPALAGLATLLQPGE